MPQRLVWFSLVSKWLCGKSLKLTLKLVISPDNGVICHLKCKYLIYNKVLKLLENENGVSPSG